MNKTKYKKQISKLGEKLWHQLIPPSRRRKKWQLAKTLVHGGTKTNTNLEIVEQIAGGYTAQDIAGGAGTTTLSVSDGATGATLSHRMIEFTGSITGNRIVTIPLDVQTFII